MDTVCIISVLSSRHKRMTVGAITYADTTALPKPTPVLHIVKHSIELRAVFGVLVLVTDFLRQSEPEGRGKLVSNISSSDSHRIMTVSRYRSDKTLGSVGISTGGRSSAHGPHSNFFTGRRHLAFLQPETVRHSNFVVIVAVLRVEEDLFDWKGKFTRLT